MRAEFQVLVIPFLRNSESKVLYGVFKRADRKIWQFISGGGEDSETPIEAARRESLEEASIKTGKLYKLDSLTMIPVYCFQEYMDKPGLYVVPEYTFAIELLSESIVLSDEHSEFKFHEYDEAVDLLQFDSNKTALWELKERIRRNDLQTH